MALWAAQPEQLVYIEQPELHLHPRAQQVMAEVLANAAKRGVRVVAETHSSILLLAVQSLVAEGKLDPALVKLHWFQRDERGATQVNSTDLDENGAYGDWPEDFGEVRAEVENRYLDAVEARAFSRRPAAKRAKVKKK
jgi:predicted ATPase